MKKVEKDKVKKGEVGPYAHSLIALTIGLAAYIIAGYDNRGIMILLFFLLTAILIELTNIRMHMAGKI